MESLDEVNGVFQSLRPLCVDVAKNPLKPAYLERLKTEILRSDGTEEIWRCLFDYVVFPLQLCLRRVTSSSTSKIEKDQRENSDRCVVEILDILEILTVRCQGVFNRPKSIPALLSDVFLLINRPPGSDEITESKSAIIAVTKFTSVLFKAIRRKETLERDPIEDQPVLAQLVYALLRCLKRSSGRESVDDDLERRVDESVVQCLDDILSLDDKVCADFLPGVSSGLAGFVLRLCSDVVSSRDQFVIKYLEIWTTLVDSANRAASTVPSSFTDEWRRNSSLQISNIFDRLSSNLASHHSPTVRHSIFETATKLLTLSNKNTANCILGDCQKRCLEVIAMSLADDQLNCESASIELTGSYNSQIEKLLLSNCCRLPRLSKSPLSTEQQASWRCLLGYLRLLRPDGVADFFLIDENGQALLRGLLRSVQFSAVSSEIKPSSNTPEETMDLTNMVTANFRRPFRFIFPSDIPTQRLVHATCAELAKLDDINVLCDQFYQYCQCGVDIVESMFFLNSILSSRPKILPPVNLDIFSSFIDFYLEKLRSSATLPALEACLVLEGLANCAITLRSNFQPNLVGAFYVVLKHLRFSDYKDYVWAALFDFAIALGYPTVLDMVMANSDYLSASLTLRLRRYSLYPHSAIILTSLLDLLPWRSIGTFRCTILETLKTIDRLAGYPTTHRDCIVSLLTVLERFCVFVTKKMPVEGPDSENKQEISEENGLEKEENLEEELGRLEINRDESKTQPAWYISLVMDILHRIRSWTFTAGVSTRLGSLGVLDEGLKVLACQDDQLLPMIHQNWPAVLCRLSDVLDDDQDERVIVVSSAAYRTILTMAYTSKDFIFRRVQDEAWPIIERILGKYLPISKRANALIYGQNPSFRLQLTILESLGDLCERIKASKNLADRVAATCRIYQSIDVLPALREAADRSVKKIENIHA